MPPTVFAPPFSSLLLCLHQGCHWPCLCFGREATVVTSGFIGLPFPVPRPRLRLRLRLRPCPDRETSGQGGRCQVLGAHGLASTELLVTPAAPPKRCSPCIDWESAKQSSLRGDKKKKSPPLPWFAHSPASVPAQWPEPIKSLAAGRHAARAVPLSGRHHRLAWPGLSRAWTRRCSPKRLRHCGRSGLRQFLWVQQTGRARWLPFQSLRKPPDVHFSSLA